MFLKGGGRMFRAHAKQIVALFVLVLSCMRALPGGPVPAQEPSAPALSLDFEFFKTRVEPIFLKRRSSHARCYACHGSGTGPQYLVSLSPGSAFWTDEQSEKNFQNVSKLVDPKDPMNSRFLIHPLSPLAGGHTAFAHSGGRQFESKEDPDWQILAEWVSGKK
jgi:hypothetical protein